jgi:signal transduction histidine kinase
MKMTLFRLALTLLLFNSGSASWASNVQKNHLLLLGCTMAPGHGRDVLLHKNSLKAPLVRWPELQRGETGNSQVGPLVFNREPFWRRNQRSLLTLGIVGIFLSHVLLVLWLLLEIHKRKLADSTLKNLSHYLISTAEQERRRIARELHDGVNQRMALLSIKLGRLLSDSSSWHPALTPRLKDILREANGISSDISRVSQELHSSALEFLGLVPALRRLCQEFSEHQNIPVNFQSAEFSGQISPDINLCLFRIAQECLTNVARHSGARSVDVQLKFEGTSGLELIVADDGRGFETAKLNERAGLGILSMRERLRLVGGELALHAAPGEGTYVAATVPSAQVNRAEENMPAAPAADAAAPVTSWPWKKLPMLVTAIMKHDVRSHAEGPRAV